MAGSGRASQPVRARGVRSQAGVDGLQRRQLAELQRARIVSGMFDVVGEYGAASVTVTHIVDRSGVSRRTFYEVFEDREDCFLAAFEEAVAHAARWVLPAYRSEGRWRDRIRAALGAFLSFLDDEPSIGRLLVCESVAGGTRALARRNELIAHVTAAVDEGRFEAKASSSEPPLTAEGVVGGSLSVIQARLGDENREPLVELVNPLMSAIVRPYLGAGAARREMARPAHTLVGEGRREQALLSDPFKDAGMRLTYRTMRALMVIAEHPHASNRQVGRRAGVADQGQISKLLSRLQRIGLVENTGMHPGKGAPNRWVVTEKGRQLTDGIRAHTVQEWRQ